MIKLLYRGGRRRKAKLFSVFVFVSFVLVASWVCSQEVGNPELTAEEEEQLRIETLEELLPGEGDAQRFLYEPEGRRDPFISLLLGKTQDSNIRPPGIDGMNISEIVLVGILDWGEKGRIALFKGTDDKTYQRKVGEGVFDGKIITIAKDQVMFEQKVYDAFGNEKPSKMIEIKLHPKKEEGL